MAVRLVVGTLFLVFAGIAAVFVYAGIAGPERLATGGQLVVEDQVGPWRLRAEQGEKRTLHLELAPATEAVADPRLPPPVVRLDMPEHDMELEPIRLGARMDGFVGTARLPMAGEWRLSVEEHAIRIEVR